MVPAQLAAVWNIRLCGGSEGPTLITNAALLRVVFIYMGLPSTFVAQQNSGLRLRFESLEILGWRYGWGMIAYAPAAARRLTRSRR